MLKKKKDLVAGPMGFSSSSSSSLSLRGILKAKRTDRQTLSSVGR